MMTDLDPAAAPKPPRFVAFDQARCEWMVLADGAVAGMPVWTVQSAHPGRAQAEAQAGLHDAPAVAWLLRDPALGWRLASGGGWLSALSLRCRMTEAEARAALTAGSGLDLLVWRADGRITCPDWQPEGVAP